MLKRVLQFFAPPVFAEDEDKTRKARYANFIAFVFLGVVVLYEAALRFGEQYSSYSIIEVILIALIVFCVISLVRLRQGHVRSASALLVVSIWVACNTLAASGYGAKDATYLSNFAITLIAGLLLGWPASVGIIVLSVGSGFGLAYAEQYKVIKVESYPVTSFARDMLFVFLLYGFLIYRLIDGLENALNKARQNSEELRAANKNLRVTQNELQVRTSDLIVAYNQLENRSKKLHAITMITHTTASIQDFDLLLESITSAISDQLGYYHVGLFLLDEHKQYAILRSANTEGGKRMQDRGYRLPINQREPIGLVVQTGQSKILQDTVDDAAPHNSDLPETKSRVLLPLESGDAIIGVLDIQSKEAKAFNEDDLSSLSILADQVAITIQNSLLYEQSQNALREAGITSLESSSQAWKGYEKGLSNRGYRYDGIKSEPLKLTRMTGTEKESLSIPVQLRGQTIGRLRLNTPDPSREWSDDELAIVRATAERAALALESARLLDEAQKRATREAFLSEVSTKLSSSFQLDSILRDTVQELGQTLKNSTVTFQLVNPSATATMEEKSNGESGRNEESDSHDEH